VSGNGNHPDTDPDELAADTPRTSGEDRLDQVAHRAAREIGTAELVQLGERVGAMEAVNRRLVPQIEALRTEMRSAIRLLNNDVQANTNSIDALTTDVRELNVAMRELTAAVREALSTARQAKEQAEDAEDKAEITGQHALGAALKMADRFADAATTEAKARVAMASRTNEAEIDVAKARRKTRIKIVGAAVVGAVSLFLAWLASKLGLR